MRRQQKKRENYIRVDWHLIRIEVSTSKTKGKGKSKVGGFIMKMCKRRTQNILLENKRTCHEDSSRDDSSSLGWEGSCVDLTKMKGKSGKSWEKKEWMKIWRSVASAAQQKENETKQDLNLRGLGNNTSDKFSSGCQIRGTRFPFAVEKKSTLEYMAFPCTDVMLKCLFLAEALYQRSKQRKDAITLRKTYTLIYQEYDLPEW